MFARVMVDKAGIYFTMHDHAFIIYACLFGMDFMHIFQYNQNKVVLWVTWGFYSKQFYLLACFLIAYYFLNTK